MNQATEQTWTPTQQQLPTKGQKIEWISPGGLHERGKYLGGVIWMPEGSPMYVYYTPQFWRPVQEGA